MALLTELARRDAQRQPHRIMANTYIQICIQNQEQHHARTGFHEEYLEFLKKFDVPHDERYTFKALDEE